MGIFVWSTAKRKLSEMNRADKIDRYLAMVAIDGRPHGMVSVCDSFALDEATGANILLTSDIHTSGISGVDTAGASIVIIAGDIMGGGMDSDDAGFGYLESEFFPWCRKNGDKQIVITAGNHDKFLFRMWAKGEKIDWPKNVTYLIDREVSVNGIRMYGTPWCTKNREGRFEGTDRDLAERFSKIPKGLDILISHTPPYIPGEKIDYSDKVGVHEGSKELTEEIIKKKPRLVVCGHIHGGDRTVLKYGETTIMNVARVHTDRSKESFKPKLIRFTFEK